MKVATFKGKFEDLKPPRFFKCQKDPFTDMAHVQKPIGNGVCILIYENGDIRTEINGLIFPNAKYIEESLKKMNLEVEYAEVKEEE